MSSDWLEIPDENAAEIERGARVRSLGCVQEEDPKRVADTLREQMIGASAEDVASGERVPIWPIDCDVEPHGYVIDWRLPVLGPIHALVRRVINAEIRRYLLPMLRKQSYYNRQVMSILQDLSAENMRLRRQLEERGNGQE